jgi:hypothetical protein
MNYQRKMPKQVVITGKGLSNSGQYGTDYECENMCSGQIRHSLNISKEVWLTKGSMAD